MTDPNCPNCKGTGIVEVDGAVVHCACGDWLRGEIHRAADETKDWPAWKQDPRLWVLDQETTP